MRVPEPQESHDTMQWPAFAGLGLMQGLWMLGTSSGSWEHRCLRAAGAFVLLVGGAAVVIRRGFPTLCLVAVAPPRSSKLSTSTGSAAFSSPSLKNSASTALKCEA